MITFTLSHADEWRAWGGNVGKREHLDRVIVDTQRLTPFGSSNYHTPDSSLATPTAVAAAGVGGEEERRRRNHWSYRRSFRHEDNDHICYGTTQAHSVGVFLFPVSAEHCINRHLHGSCALEVELLHSWNTSYISNSQCSVNSVETVDNQIVLGGELHHMRAIANRCPPGKGGSSGGGHGHDGSSTIRGTFPCTHRIPLVNVAGDRLALLCESDE